MADMTRDEALAPFIGPRFLKIEIDMVPYRGAHTRRAVKGAMTRAGVDWCLVDLGGGFVGLPYNAADLAHIRQLG